MNPWVVIQKSNMISTLFLARFFPLSFTQSASGEMRFRLGSQTRTEIRENKLCSRRGKQATKSLELGEGGRDTKGPFPPLCTPIPSSLTMRNQQRGGKFDCAEESILFKHNFVGGGKRTKGELNLGLNLGGQRATDSASPMLAHLAFVQGLSFSLSSPPERIHSAPFASKQHHRGKVHSSDSVALCKPEFKSNP